MTTTFTSSPSRARHNAHASKRETAEAIIIEGSGYALRVWRKQPIAELELNGLHVASLDLASGVDTLDGIDELTELSAAEVSHDKEGITLTWRGVSTLWRGKTVELRAWRDGFSYGYTLEGRGAIDRAYLMRSQATPSKAHAVRLFTPEPNSGHVRYSGDRCSPDKNCVMCYPEKATDMVKYNGPADFMTISVGRDRYFHDGNWLFTPSPYCYAVEGAGNWLALGVAAQPGEWMFTDFEYTGGGFGFGLVYEGHVEVNGSWRSPRLVCLTAADEYDAIQRYCDFLREKRLAPSHGRGPVHDWWREPIFCGWGEQVSQEVHAGNPGSAADRATQASYEEWLATLDAHGINPGTAVIDDKWQLTYGCNDIDTAKWPDMAGFMAGQHLKGRHVLLWLNAWSGRGLPCDECILGQDAASPLVDPGNPAYRARFTEQIRYLLQEIGADGFKIDFSHLIPRGRAPRSAGGLWGLELMRQWFELISGAARLAKPDALLIAHAANPYLADLIDVLRLNDVAGLMDPFGTILPDMGHRARIARSASPYWLLDADNWPCSSRPQWREYVLAQATGQFGIPSLYHAGRLAWGQTDDPLTEEDYEAIRTAWAGYRATLKQSNIRRDTVENPSGAVSGELLLTTER